MRLARAASVIADRVPNAALDLVGIGVRASTIEEAVTNLHLAEWVPVVRFSTQRDVLVDLALAHLMRQHLIPAGTVRVVKSFLAAVLLERL